MKFSEITDNYWKSLTSDPSGFSIKKIIASRLVWLAVILIIFHTDDKNFLDVLERIFWFVLAVLGVRATEKILNKT